MTIWKCRKPASYPVSCRSDASTDHFNCGPTLPLSRPRPALRRPPLRPLSNQAETCLNRESFSMSPHAITSLLHEMGPLLAMLPNVQGTFLPRGNYINRDHACPNDG
ncbi:hypothetical protein BO83DRAFT_43185 [Aspergillus eucalypticola CBS 122712]|uniref:Uncharacterized protein n=1 Tax=Aspergillus eucalypticola (strain CBS 122712 / IBT 29274) TaxID=1448314 RepID=A0A317VCB2_ASPEC|nr:uncharacterized protein BO83DRAFT_43185 [Aspergillus eucalypticola CBS 122712]PWY71876.1 hypothetical protein BO83DRAFT_43185 [Aspergillus eucalypticola CBS 122712]